MNKEQDHINFWAWDSNVIPVHFHFRSMLLALEEAQLLESDCVQRYEEIKELTMEKDCELRKEP